MITQLTLFAIWCGFDDEFWHISRNCVIHSVGIRRLRFNRRVQDAELDIVERIGAKFSTPNYRLYAGSDGEQPFLFQKKIGGAGTTRTRHFRSYGLGFSVERRLGLIVMQRRDWTL
jgi:hypothetical protein